MLTLVCTKLLKAVFASMLKCPPGSQPATKSPQSIRTSQKCTFPLKRSQFLWPSGNTPVSNLAISPCALALNSHSPAGIWMPRFSNEVKDHSMYFSASSAPSKMHSIQRCGMTTPPHLLLPLHMAVHRVCRLLGHRQGTESRASHRNDTECVDLYKKF